MPVATVSPAKLWASRNSAGEAAGITNFGFERRRAGDF